MAHGGERDSTDDWLVPDEFGHAAADAPSAERSVIEDTLRAASAAERAAHASLVAVEAAGRAESTLRQIEDQLDRAIEISRSAAAQTTTDERIDGLALEIDRAFELIEEAGRVSRPAPADEPSMRRFSERADRIVERLRSLEERPLPIRIGSNGEPSS